MINVYNKKYLKIVLEEVLERKSNNEYFSSLPWCFLLNVDDSLFLTEVIRYIYGGNVREHRFNQQNVCKKMKFSH